MPKRKNPGKKWRIGWLYSAPLIILVHLANLSEPDIAQRFGLGGARWFSTLMNLASSCSWFFRTLILSFVSCGFSSLYLIVYCTYQDISPTNVDASHPYLLSDLTIRSPSIFDTVFGLQTKPCRMNDYCPFHRWQADISCVARCI